MLAMAVKFSTLKFLWCSQLRFWLFANCFNYFHNFLSVFILFSIFRKYKKTFSGRIEMEINDNSHFQVKRIQLHAKIELKHLNNRMVKVTRNCSQMCLVGILSLCFVPDKKGKGTEIIIIIIIILILMISTDSIKNS